MIPHILVDLTESTKSCSVGRTAVMPPSQCSNRKIEHARHPPTHLNVAPGFDRRREELHVVEATAAVHVHGTEHSVHLSAINPVLAEDLGKRVGGHRAGMRILRREFDHASVACIR